MCRLCQMKSTMIWQFVESVEWNRPCYAQVSTLWNGIDRDWLRLICSIVDSYWPWWAHGTTLSIKIDPDSLMCPDCRLKSTSSTHLSTMSTAIDSDPLMCRLCWLLLTSIGSWNDSVDSNDCYWLMSRFSRIKLTLTCSCVTSVEWARPWFDNVSTRSNKIDPVIGSCVDSVDCDRPWYANVSTLSS